MFSPKWANTKQLILFGPPFLGRLGFTDTFTEQAISQLTLFIGHIRRNKENQEPLNNLDEEPSADYRFWKTDLWVQLLSHREMLRKVVDHQSLAILEVNQGNNSRRQRVDTTSSKGKRYLYHGDFQPSKHEISPKELRCLNACRIYLQTLTLADMCDSSGRVVCSNILKGARHIDCRSQCNWANQAPPIGRCMATMESSCTEGILPKYERIPPLEEKPW